MSEGENVPPSRAQASRVYSSIGAKLYLNSATADVTFIVGRSVDQCERVPVHKVLLITASEVFETMFNESWKERDEVRIVDATAASFKEFLQFFYLDEVKLTMENVSNVMNLGKKYGIDEFLDLCADFVITKMTADNVCCAYELAIFFEHKRLWKFCELMIGMNTKQVFQSTSFAECECAIVHEILKLDELDCTEAELFKATMSWIKAKSDQTELSKELVDQYLGGHFKEFRFGSMSFEDFSKLVPSYGEMFSQKEYQDIIQAIASSEYKSKFFNDKRKKRLKLELDYLLNRSLFNHRSEKPYLIKDIETTVFSTDKSVLLIMIISATESTVVQSFTIIPMKSMNITN